MEKGDTYSAVSVNFFFLLVLFFLWIFFFEETQNLHKNLVRPHQLTSGTNNKKKTLLWSLVEVVHEPIYFTSARRDFCYCYASGQRVVS